MRRDEKILNNEFYTVRGYQILDAKKNVLTSSMEDYLEMIYRICLEEDYIRVKKLAEKLNVRPSSTTKVVQKLNKFGLVKYEKYGMIQLTEEGKEIGNFLLKRHNIIESFLKKIGIKENLLKDTEMIEHDISLDTLRNIHILNEFFTSNPSIIDMYKSFKNDYKKSFI
ncbi:MAG: metal-dependent transcriptional regulator [Eubacteriaceae bacterium]